MIQYIHENIKKYSNNDRIQNILQNINGIIDDFFASSSVLNEGIK